MRIGSSLVPKGRVVFPVDSRSSVTSSLQESREFSRVINCESDFTPASEPK